MESVFELASTDTQLKKVAASEYAGPCPACGGRDRFHVNLNKRDGRGGWMCRVCHPAELEGWGDDVDYLVAFRAMSKRDALQVARAQTKRLLDRIGGAIDQAQTLQKYAAPDNDEPPEKPWQDKARAYVERAVNRLWSQAGRAALEYVRGRGLQDATIKAAQLGYVVEQDQDGNSIPYLVIPWHAGGEQGGYWAVNRRDLRADKPKEAPRYKMVFGSSKKGLYGGALLERSRKFATFVVEGELDALILAQEARGLDINVVATGGQNTILTTWAIRLGRMPMVLLAQDNEQRGDEQAQAWLDVLEHNASRYRPLAKDINDMLLAGKSVHEWAARVLQFLPDRDQAQTSSAPDLQATPGEPDQDQDQRRPGYTVDASAYVGAPWYDATCANDAMQHAARACAWSLAGAPDSVIFDAGVLACIELFTPNPARACAWSLELRAAWLAQDIGVLVTLAGEIDYPGDEFLEGLGLQLEQPPAGELDASAAYLRYLYLDQVRAMVDDAGAWPGGYRLRLVDRAFVEQIRALPIVHPEEVVQRSSLQPLPRVKCPGLVLTTRDIPGETKRNRSQVLRACTQKTQGNGWCSEHQKAALLLDMGAALGYPRVEISDCNVIPAGRAGWESYACYAVVAMKAALPRVKRLLDQAQREPDQAAG